jgi:hypothetical protein
MPVSAIDLVKKLMAKAGVTHAGDLTSDIPDEVATALDNQLLTIAAAINNHPEVKKVYFAQAYNGLDAENGKLMDEFGFTDEIKAEIERAGGSTKKSIAIAKKIKELSDKTVPADAGKAKEMQNQIAELHTKLKAESDKQLQLQKDYEAKVRRIEVRTKIDKELSKYKTILDDQDPTVKEASINALLEKALKENDADFDFDQKGNLSLIKKDGNNIFGDNHTLVTPTSFIDKALSKILKVSPPAQTTPPAASVPGGQQNPQNTALNSAIDQALQSYEMGAKNVVTI